MWVVAYESIDLVVNLVQNVIVHDFTCTGLLLCNRYSAAVITFGTLMTVESLDHH